MDAGGAPQLITSHDGARLAVFSLGPKKGPVLFLINGLGGNFTAWRHIVSRFADRFRILSFDYRGMYCSPAPENRDFSMHAHSLDALAVLDHFRVKHAVVMGWSMGVQVCLEVYRQAPERVRGLVLANGAWGRPLDRGIPGLKAGAQAVMDLLALAQNRLRPLAAPLIATSLPVEAAKLAGFVSRRLDEKVFLGLAGDFVNLDFASYSRCVETLLNHDAGDMLETIRVPTLIISGGRDLFTPAAMSREMERRIPDATRLHLQDASHYAAVEYPDAIADAMKKFFTSKISWR